MVNWTLELGNNSGVVNDTRAQADYERLLNKGYDEEFALATVKELYSAPSFDAGKRNKLIEEPGPAEVSIPMVNLEDPDAEPVMTTVHKDAIGLTDEQIEDGFTLKIEDRQVKIFDKDGAEVTSDIHNFTSDSEDEPLHPVAAVASEADIVVAGNDTIPSTEDGVQDVTAEAAASSVSEVNSSADQTADAVSEVAVTALEETIPPSSIVDAE